MSAIPKTGFKRFSELELVDHRSVSGINQLNESFHRYLRDEVESPVAGFSKRILGQAELSVSGHIGRDIGHAEDLEMVDEVCKPGDVFIVSIGAEAIRVKNYGIWAKRIDSKKVWDTVSATIAVDEWDPVEEVWDERNRFISVRPESSHHEQVRGIKLRVSVQNGPGLFPEDDFQNLLLGGLTPEVALDFWMVELRGVPLEEWVEVRGINEKEVRDNISIDRAQLPEIYRPN